MQREQRESSFDHIGRGSLRVVIAHPRQWAAMRTFNPNEYPRGRERDRASAVATALTRVVTYGSEGTTLGESESHT